MSAEILGQANNISQFQKGLSKVGPGQGAESTNSVVKPGQEGLFKEALQKASHVNASLSPNSAQTAQPIELKFSNHAVDRMKQRGLSFNQELLQKIDAAVTQAAEKGAKETLVVTEKAAMVVGVEKKTVITLMDVQAMRDNVFTNIDSTVFV